MFDPTFSRNHSLKKIRNQKNDIRNNHPFFRLSKPLIMEKKSSSSSHTQSEYDSSLEEDASKMADVCIHDPLEVSRFPDAFRQVLVTLTKIQELKIVQKLLKEIKFVLSFDENVIQSQDKYWLYTHKISNSDQRERLRIALETHCCVPVSWQSDNEIEIVINPDCKIIKKRPNQ